jgi:hypothetical protein
MRQTAIWGASKLARFTLVAVVSAGLSHVAVAQQTSGCRPADASLVPQRIKYLKQFISSAVPVYKSVRDSVGLGTTTNAPRLVTVTKGCQNAVAALNTLLGTPGRVRRVWMFEMSPVAYAVEDPGIPAVPGEPAPLFMFTSQLQYKGTLRVF